MVGFENREKTEKISGERFLLVHSGAGGHIRIVIDVDAVVVCVLSWSAPATSESMANRGGKEKRRRGRRRRKNPNVISFLFSTISSGPLFGRLAFHRQHRQQSATATPTSASTRADITRKNNFVYFDGKIRTSNASETSFQIAVNQPVSPFAASRSHLPSCPFLIILRRINS